MIVDIAHSSHATVADILQMAQRPVVSSHGGVQAVCGVNRNLTDAEIRGVAATGGVIGLGYWDGAMCDTDPATVARAVKHVRDLVGIEYVALGSDFDGAVTTRFDASGLVADYPGTDGRRLYRSGNPRGDGAERVAGDQGGTGAFVAKHSRRPRPITTPALRMPVRCEPALA